MAAVYDVGTPIGGERKFRRMRSPLQEMDSVVGELDFAGDAHQVPATPGDAQPVTMAAMRQLFDEKLKPVTDTMEELRDEVTEL